MSRSYGGSVWEAADKTERLLNRRFPALWCGVYADGGKLRVEVYMLRAALVGGSDEHILTTHEPMGECPSPTLITQLMLLT